MRLLTTALAASALALCSPWALADTGTLLLTGGVSSIDGAAGGGLTPWAVVGDAVLDSARWMPQITVGLCSTSARTRAAWGRC